MEPSVEELVQWDRQYFWHPFTPMSEYEPLVIACAQGCELVDIRGRRFVDGVASLWCNVHGHRHPVIDEAIRRQLDQVAHVTALGMAHPVTIRLARRLADLAPPPLQHVFFSSDGACAVEVALKMAFQFWRQVDPPQTERTLYVAFDQAYHGDTLGSVSVGGVARFHAMFRPLLFRVLRLPAPDPYRPPPGVAPDQVGQYVLDLLEQALRRHRGQIAAVVVEPLVQAAAGILVHPAGFLRGLREITSRHEVLLIADEVAVGMGKTGTMLACQQEDVVPDFLCLGKGLTGGYLPMSATITTPQVFQAFLGPYEANRTFFHGHTYAGNPLAAAAALATLDLFQRENTLEHVRQMAALLAQRLEPLRQYRHVGDIRQCGLIAGVELVADKATRQPFPAAFRAGARVCRIALQHGVWLRPLGDVVVIMPPLAIRREQLERIVTAVEAGVRQLEQ